MRANDIAILKLRKNAITKRAGYFAPMGFDYNISLKEGDCLTIAGYGVTKNIHIDDSGTLIKTNVKISYINKERGIFHVIAKDTGSCIGDSGGPAYYKKGNVYFLIGLLSGGKANNKTGICLFESKFID